MAEEKKKGGFWSWLGLGKKKEEKVEQPEVVAESPELEQATSVEATEPTPLAEETITVAVETEQSPAPETEIIEKKEIPVEKSAVDSSFVFSSNEEKDELPSVSVKENETIEEVNSTQNTKTEDVDENKNIDESKDAEEAVEIDITEEIKQRVVNVDEIIETGIDTIAAENDSEKIPEEQETVEHEQLQEKPSEGGFFSRLVKGLLKTKQNIGASLLNFFSGKKIDDDLFEELEEQLLIADIGVPTTSKIIKNLTEHASRQQLKNAELLYQQLKAEMSAILAPVAQPLVIDENKKPYVILMVGVNGVGKTTTIGKLARKFQSEGKSVMLAAGDTFRAAAVEQLQVWGERNHIPVVAQGTGSDSASVIFDAMESAAARNIDILIADTAGRLQNKNNLMDELKKIVRVMKKYDETAPHEIMLTLDAGTGQNAISQAKLFNEAVGLTGISLTKLDGTAKGGVIFAIADQFNLPIRYIGVGEKIDDLRPFQAEEFIDALFSQESDK